MHYVGFLPLLKKAMHVACVSRGPEASRRKGKLGPALGFAVPTSNFSIHLVDENLCTRAIIAFMKTKYGYNG